MSSVEIKVGQKWIAMVDIAFWKKGTTAEITETGACIRFKNSDGQEEFIFNNPEDVVWFKSVYELVADDRANEEMGAAESLRNSILDIRSKREALQREILLLDEQEEETVEKLKEQGFVLYEGNVSKEPVITENKVVLYVEDIEEDMTNYENWKNGDILEVITKSDSQIPFGTLVKHADVDGCMSPYTRNECHDWWAIEERHLKCHSRPIK